jgi:hypothetical protein
MFIYCILLYITLDICPTVVWQGPKAVLFLIYFEEPSHSFHMAVLVYIPTDSIGGFLLNCILTSIFVVCFLDDCQTYWIEIEP